MLNSGKKICASCNKKKILTLVLSEKKFLNETKNHNPPPLQVKWSVPNCFVVHSSVCTCKGKPVLRSIPCDKENVIF